LLRIGRLVVKIIPKIRKIPRAITTFGARFIIYFITISSSIEILQMVNSKKKEDIGKPKQGKNHANEHQDDDEDDSLELLTRARISFAATEEVVGEPEVQSPAAEQAEEDEMKRYLDEVLVETDLLRHTRLLEKAAADSKQTKGKVLRPVNALESIKRSIKIVQEEIFPDKKISVKTIDNIYSATAGARNVLADELLDELFLNLIANAAKYTDSNYVPLEVTLHKEEDKGNRLKITISDFGHGIPDRLKYKIFERYDPTVPSNAAEDSRLSLFIVKKLVDDYKGEIYVRNRVPDDFSKGTVYTVLLPLAIS
jgi:signal transduction histidine kinase